MAAYFISYNRQSEAIVETLAADVEALGHDAWFDRELSGGQRWWDRILAQIRNCEVFVFALAPQALNSTPCAREYQYAAYLGKPILPVLVADGVSTNLLPPALSALQFVDYRKRDPDTVLRLARAISHIPPPKPLPDPLPEPPELPLSHLGRLHGQVSATSDLSFQEQSALVVDLKSALRDPETHQDARTLLDTLIKRRDLYARISREIDEILAGTPSPSSASAASTAKQPKQSKETESGTIKVNPGEGLEYVWIAPGRFLMGAVPGDDYAEDGEKPQHPVEITKGFWLGRTPVTVEAYRRFVKATRGKMPDAPDINPTWKHGDHPIVNVSWEEAQKYCVWAAGRLPTEAEWEYAARGGKEGLLYPNGNELTDKDAKYTSVGTSSVGSFPANGFGLHDMAGNVWEWTADWFGPYREGEQSDPKGPDDVNKKVVRGGSWIDNPMVLRVSKRYRNEPDNRVNDVGFRCAREVFP